MEILNALGKSTTKYEDSSSFWSHTMSKNVELQNAMAVVRKKCAKTTEVDESFISIDDDLIRMRSSSQVNSSGFAHIYNPTKG